MDTNKRGRDILNSRSLNKSTSFNRKERDTLGLRGLLPYAESSQAMQINRVMGNLRRKEYDIERYIFLSALQDRNERLYYQTIIEHTQEILPLIYTPTVGQACKEFSHIYRHAQGLFITPEDKGMMDTVLGNWPEDDVRVIVITDGQRILGLGDLGANGMGIPIGKLALYVASAGIHPHQCLPVMFDVGTNNMELLDDPLYIGYPHRRLEGDEYYALMDEFIQAVLKRYPDVLIQFEDFQTPNAYALLRKYEKQILCFNDDIQGTAAVALAGVFASCRITQIPYKDLRIMFLGAGSAATGIGDLMVKAFIERGLSKEEAQKRLWFLDGKGLVVSSRTDLAEHKQPFAHDFPFLNLTEAIKAIKPQVLIGATGTGGSFTKEVIELMTELNPRPVIFALSNPTDRAECTAKEAYEWSDGKAIFASGSPFAPVEHGAQVFKPGQGNNAYIFPGVGLAALITKAKILPEEVFLIAAKALANNVTQENIDQGSLYPEIKGTRQIAPILAEAVAEKLFEGGFARVDRPADLRKVILEYMYDPRY